MGHALPVTEMRLAQSGVGPHRRTGALGEHDCGVIGAPQIGGNDQQRLVFAEHLGGSGGLRAAEIG
jgi:hypothetical protein